LERVKANKKKKQTMSIKYSMVKAIEKKTISYKKIDYHKTRNS